MYTPLEEAAQLIDSGRFRILSLDIFDTAVWRDFPVPSDLFYALGHIVSQKNFLYPSSSAASFGMERLEAEKTARTKRERDSEVTLREIYECFPQGYLRPGCAPQVLDLELAIERERTHPDEQAASLIDYAVQRGLRIAFVSDTYFDQKHLRSILPRPADLLIPSCEFRRSKTQGLHSELVRQSGVKASEILHIGDNRDADSLAPAKLGIKTVWRPRFPKALGPALESELPSYSSDRAIYFSSETGDAGLTALRSQSLQSADIWSDAHASWGAAVLGPVMAAFGRWVVERCDAEGIGVALCLMREGQILKRVLDSFPADVRAMEFFASRFALVRASILTGEVDELEQFLLRPRPSRADELLQPLGLAPDELEIRADTLIDGDAACRLARRIAKSEEWRARAVAASSASRKRFITYLRAALPELPRRVALVDLGYSGSIQRCLQAILRHEGIECQTHGLYFVTGGGIRKVQRAGAVAEGFLAENGQPLSIAHSFMRSPELVEQALMCDSGSTLDYTEDGSPVLGEQLAPAGQIAQIFAVQKGMMAFVRSFASHPGLRRADLSRLRPFLDAILVRALTRPTESELEAFGSWVHDENLGSRRTRTLIAVDLEDEYLQHASAHQLASLQSAQTYWIFGVAQSQGPAMGEAIRSIFLRKAKPYAFDSPTGERLILFFWNDGATHRAEQPYTLSNRCAAWARFSLQFHNADLHEIGFSVGKPGDLIRVGAIVLRLHREGEPVKVVRKFPGSLETFGLEAIPHAPAAFCVTDLAGLVAPVNEVRNFTGAVQIDFLFSHYEADGSLGEPDLVPAGVEVELSTMSIAEKEVVSS